jgi:hypothetical protein
MLLCHIRAGCPGIHWSVGTCRDQRALVTAGAAWDINYLSSVRRLSLMQNAKILKSHLADKAKENLLNINMYHKVGLCTLWMSVWSC